jgi:serine/threonine-protein kinase
VTEASTQPAGASSSWAGQVLDGRYRILELLGEGGMGAVYVAEHLSLRKQVALKMIHPEYAGNQEIAARFTREAMATAQLDHPNVASALDYGTLPDGGAYLVTQLVRGRSLEHHRAAGKMAWKQVCDLGAQIADALTAAHAIHIVHRDLKPDNILLIARDDGGFLVKVLDFGIARITDTSALPKSDLTRMGTVIGTPGYMAPEQAMGEQVDHLVDLYALGVILWECLVGRTLWNGDTLTDLYTRQLSGPAPPLAGEAPGLPPELCALVDMLLDRNPKRRPESARQVREALRRMSHGTIALGHAPVVPAPVQPVPLPRWVVPSLVGFGVLVLVLAIVALAGGGKDDEAPAADAKAPDPPAVMAPPTPAPPEAEAEAEEPPVRKGRSEAPDAKAEPPTPAAAATELPAALTQAVETLQTGKDRKARKKAAEAVLGHQPADAVPGYARNIAALEKASSCEGRKTAIQKIAEAGDPKALPALRHLSKSPRKGCGFFNAQDCNACLRELLAKTIGQLEAG